MAAKKTVKKAAKKAAKKAVTAKKAASRVESAKKTPPAPDLVARAAYLNYRRRVEQGLPGDSHGDWLEAERQLADESPQS